MGEGFFRLVLLAKSPAPFGELNSEREMVFNPIGDRQLFARVLLTQIGH
jgi:hypothetical protein